MAEQEPEALPPMKKGGRGDFSSGKDCLQLDFDKLGRVAKRALSIFLGGSGQLLFQPAAGMP